MITKLKSWVKVIYRIKNAEVVKDVYKFIVSGILKILVHVLPLANYRLGVCVWGKGGGD